MQADNTSMKMAVANHKLIRNIMMFLALPVSRKIQ